MATIAPPARPAEIEKSDIGGGFRDIDPGGGGGDSPQDPRPAFPLRRYRTGMWFALAPIVMLFTAFGSAYIVRQGLSDDWQPTALPGLLWGNSLVLVASSVTMEIARRRTAGLPAAGINFRVHPFPRVPAIRKWLMTTLLLGGLFLLGQLVAWSQMVARGVYLATNPSSSFFYLLTGAHGLHLLGGILGLAGVTAAVWNRLTPGGKTGIAVAAIYWHFMDGLWMYVLALLVLVP